MIDNFEMRESAGNEENPVMHIVANNLAPVSKTMGASPETRGNEQDAKLAITGPPASQPKPARAAKSGKKDDAPAASLSLPSLQRFGDEAIVATHIVASNVPARH